MSADYILGLTEKKENENKGNVHIDYNPQNKEVVRIPMLLMSSSSTWKMLRVYRKY